jgi:hypothetical protein
VSVEPVALPRRIERLLQAAYPGHRRQSNEAALRDYARKLKAKAFPQFSTPLEFIFLNSRRRSCRQAFDGDQGFIIVDQGQATLMAVEDFVLRGNSFAAEDSLTLLQIAFAEAFEHNGEKEHALICTLRALAQGPRLTNLLRTTFADAGHSTVGVFLLLHEMAHFAVDTGQPFTKPVWATVSDTLEDHCRTNLEYADIIERGGALPPDVETSVQGQSAEARAVMARQMREHVGFVRNNREVLRETSCDYLATVAMLTWRSGIDALTAESPTGGTLTARNVGDVMALGLRVSRLLMLRHFIELTAENIARQEDPSRLSNPFSEITARHNVLVNLMLHLFEKIMATWTFAEPVDSVAYVKAFRRDVEITNARSADRLLKQVEEIGTDHREPDHHGSDLANLRAEFFQGAAPRDEELRATLDAHMAKLPF